MSVLKREKVTAKIVFHNRAKVIAAGLSKRYLSHHDFNEAARWADAAKAHRFAADSLRELLGD
jgi:hypothetical protein